MIESLLAASESKTLEFKRDLSSAKPLLKSLVAFANSAGGRLVIGVADDKQIIGVDDPLLKYTLPEKPNSRLQKYRLTRQGRSLIPPSQRS